MTRPINEALIMIDIQNDFCSDGALAVKRGEEIVPLVNQLQNEFAVKVLTQDWHPQDTSPLQTITRQTALRDDRDALRPSGSLAKPLRAGHQWRCVPQRPENRQR